MRKKVFFFIIGFTALGILLSAFSLLNVQASIKAEAIDGCISKVTGANLCQRADMFKGLMAAGLLMALFLFINRKRFYTNPSN